MNIQWKNEWTVPSVVGVVSFGVGVGLGYVIHVYKTKGVIREFEEIMERIEDEALEAESETDNETLTGAPFFVHEEEIDEMISKLSHPSTTIEVIPDVEGEPHLYFSVSPASVFSVFPSIDEEEDWDYVEEMAKRTPENPYIIHRDEYEDDNEGYEGSTLTYYQGDDILCDEHDVPVYNPQHVVGTLIFGKGSDDPNVVYIRNERLQAEYEVLLDHGYFAVEVLGQEIEDSFENKKAPLQKFKQDQG